MDRKFSFEISLSVLNHLGRNLYRSFITVLGEAISNSWDADAQNVWLYIDRENKTLIIKDDGTGMDSADFQDKFLRIGYSKRKSGMSSSNKGRPYIGRKGIGKLALLSCAEKASIITKKESGDYVGGVIDNSSLDEAITHDLTPEQYPLQGVEIQLFKTLMKNHDHGTIIYFENIKEGIRNTIEYLKKMIALYFRFSLLDDNFNIFLDDEKITFDCLDDLAKRTQYLWVINELNDPFINSKLSKPPLKRERKSLTGNTNLQGFIASVGKPRDLRIITTEDRVSIDLFVNGRLRERDILKHMPTARIVESYLYGQIHYNELDDDTDRFTSSRESIVADDPKYKSILDDLSKKIMTEIIDDWDMWRVEDRQNGDPDNTRISKKERSSRSLFSAVSKEYSIPDGSDYKAKVNDWVNALANDAQFNFSSYAECFISENLIRNLIQDKKITLSDKATAEITKMKKKERENKGRGNISINIRQENTGLTYLDMDGLANLVDKAHDQIKNSALSRDAKEYKPIRDAIAHTALLTDLAKNKLTSVYENLKSRIIILLSRTES